MKQLLALITLLLTVVSAQAQTEKPTLVTKLPGEENLSIRERAERDFLMPVRRKKAVAETPKTIGEEVTASPETDGVTTAHFAEATDEVRSEEAAPAREARASHVSHTRAVRHTAHHSSTRSHKASKSKSSKAKSSSKSHSTKSSSHKASHKSTKAKTKTSHTKSSKKSTAHKTTKKAATHKASSKKKHRR